MRVAGQFAWAGPHTTRRALKRTGRFVNPPAAVAPSATPVATPFATGRVTIRRTVAAACGEAEFFSRICRNQTVPPEIDRASVD